MVEPMNMYTLIKNFPQQLEEAITLHQQIQLTPANKPIHHVIIAGMGGSGIGGMLVKQWMISQLPLPIASNQNNTLPAYVNPHTLLLIVSYSGNTQETIQIVREGLHRQAKLICITAGGVIQTMAAQYGIDHILLPTGMLPRACLGHVVVRQLLALQFHQLTTWDFITALQTASRLLEKAQPTLQVEAQQIATQLTNKLPIIYTTVAYEAVAIRFRQQLNENSKQLCWHHIIPEMNHNELAAWHTYHPHLAVLMLNPYVQGSSFQAPMQRIQAIIQKNTSTLISIYPQGDTHFVRSLYLIHLCDWISYYLAQAKGIDPVPIAVIDALKATQPN